MLSREDFFYRKVKWKCRRGILEVEILLLRYFEEKFLTLTVAEQQRFDQLLDQSDSVLLDWLLGRIPAPAEYQDLINKICRNTH